MMDGRTAIDQRMTSPDSRYRQDMFSRYNQTFQYFFDQSSRVETEFKN